MPEHRRRSWALPPPPRVAVVPPLRLTPTITSPPARTALAP
jgi:hypothetical protein